MKKFASLIKTLDSTNKTNLKVEALSNYFLKSSNDDMLWAIALMSHRRPKRPLTTTLLRQWASEDSNLPQWLFEESYHIVCLLYTSPSPRDRQKNRMPSSA